MAFSFVKTEKKGRTGTIILSRADKKNALNDVMVTELQEAFTLMEEDNSIRVIVVKAEGDVFSAGADLDYLQRLQSFSFEENLADSHNLKRLFLKINTLKKVVIAQVEGHAIAGGCGLATVCDFCFAVPEAKFGYTEVRIGFIPALVMVFLLPKIGVTRAKELLLTGKWITAEKAAEIGLINEIVAGEKIEEHVMAFAETLASEASGQSLAATKEMMHRVPFMKLEEALDYAATMNANARGSEDCKKGIDAFLKKEKFSW